MEEGNSVTQEVEQVVPVENNTQEVVSEKESYEEKMVPLSVVQKERKKRQQVQEENDLLRSQQKTQLQEEDCSKYETVTREELGKSNFETLRSVREESWAESFPDKANHVNEELEYFIKQRPNLALAIQNSPNRLKEAWELMTALQPRKEVAKAQRKDVPASPGSVPKSAAMNETVDVMNMSDSEFRDWRKGKARRR